MRNLTHTDPRELYTGLTDLSEKGFMVSWHKKKASLFHNSHEETERDKVPRLFFSDIPPASHPGELAQAT